MEVNVPQASNDNQGWTKVSYRKKRKYVKREPATPTHYAIVFAHSLEFKLFKFVAVSRNPVGSLLMSTKVENSLDDRLRISSGLDLDYIGRYELNNLTYYHIYIYNYQLYLPHMENFRWMARGEIVDYRGIYDQDMGILIPGRYPSWIEHNFPPPIQNWLHNIRTNFVIQGRDMEAPDSTENDKNSHGRPDHLEQD